MSYALRNSIVLVILLLIVVLIGGYIWGIRQPAKIEELQTRITRLDREIARIPNLIAEFNSLTEAVEDQRRRWQLRSKDVPQADFTAQTYDMFNRAIDQSGGYVRLDMSYGGAQSHDRYGYNVYYLRGEAPFPEFYRFLWHVENGRRLYKINQFTARGVETQDPELELPTMLVTFEMEMHGYFTSVPELHTSTGQRSVRPNVLTANPYRSLIFAEIPPNVRELVEAERAELRAVIPGKAILVDHTGMIRTLEEGDEVYLGYVTRIVPEESKVEFTLNKGGIIERFNLFIRYNGNTKTR